MQQLSEMSEGSLRAELDKLDYWAQRGGIDEEQAQRRQALDRELRNRKVDKALVLRLIREFQQSKDPLTEAEAELFDDYCDSTIGECDACGATAPLLHDFCAWGCES